jgi:hypothetical protein
MTGMYRGNQDNLANILMYQCCTPCDETGQKPRQVAECMDANWVKIFNAEGWAECPKDTYLHGLYKSSCNHLSCIEYGVATGSSAAARCQCIIRSPCVQAGAAVSKARAAPPSARPISRGRPSSPPARRAGPMCPSTPSSLRCTAARSRRSATCSTRAPARSLPTASSSRVTKSICNVVFSVVRPGVGTTVKL